MRSKHWECVDLRRGNASNRRWLKRVVAADKDGKRLIFDDCSLVFRIGSVKKRPNRKRPTVNKAHLRMEWICSSASLEYVSFR